MALFKKTGFFTEWARFFNLGNSGRAVYTKPNGVDSNPVNSVLGSQGLPVWRTMSPLRPAVVLGGNTLTINSVSGTATLQFFAGATIDPLFEPVAGPGANLGI